MEVDVEAQAPSFAGCARKVRLATKRHTERVSSGCATALISYTHITQCRAVLLLRCSVSRHRSLTISLHQHPHYTAVHTITHT